MKPDSAFLLCSPYPSITTRRRSVVEKKELVDHVQQAMARIREHAAAREEHVAELLRDNASLRASAATMQQTLNRCDKQLAELAGRPDPSGAVTWCVTPVATEQILHTNYMAFPKGWGWGEEALHLICT